MTSIGLLTRKLENLHEEVQNGPDHPPTHPSVNPLNFLPKVGQIEAVTIYNISCHSRAKVRHGAVTLWTAPPPEVNVD